MKKQKAVILGANYYIGLSIARCLGEHNIPIVALDHDLSKAYAASSKYVSERWQVPHYKTQSNALLEWMISYAKKQDHPPVLFPIADPYVQWMDEHFNILKQYYLFPAVKNNFMSNLLNKKKLYHLMDQYNITYPETIYPQGAYWKQVTEEIGYPCLIKPVDSPAFVAKYRQKVFQIENEGQLVEKVNRAEQDGFEVMIQRIVPGFDDHVFTYDFYRTAKGEIDHWITCQKLRQYPIHFGASVYTKQKYVPILHKIGTSFLDAIDYRGFGEIEFKLDIEKKKFYLIELNVRTTTLNVLLRDLGINFPYLQYAEMTKAPLVEPYTVTVDTNRAFWYAFEDIFSIKNYVQVGDMGILDAIESLGLKKSYAIWNCNDMKPMIHFYKNLWNKHIKKSR